MRHFAPFRVAARRWRNVPLALREIFSLCTHLVLPSIFLRPTQVIPPLKAVMIWIELYYTWTEISPEWTSPPPACFGCSPTPSPGTTWSWWSSSHWPTFSLNTGYTDNLSASFYPPPSNVLCRGHWRGKIQSISYRSGSCRSHTGLSPPPGKPWSPPKGHRPIWISLPYKMCTHGIGLIPASPDPLQVSPTRGQQGCATTTTTLKHQRRGAFDNR